MAVGKETLPSAEEIIARLHALGSPEARAGMARYGIDTARALGVPASRLRPLAREIGRDHALAQRLWNSGIHEARLLAILIGDPRRMGEAAMDSWAGDFDSWDICDGACINLFRKTPFAHSRAVAWAGREKTFVKRAGFALMATLAVHDKRAEDAVFRPICRSSGRRRRTSATSSRRRSTGRSGKSANATGR